MIAEIRSCAAKNQRVLVTTLTKKSSERLSDYLSEVGINAAYLHSELDAFERVRVLKKLREGSCDCVIGINLLREGIDLPEVALVAILDADKTGFLRSVRSLVQTAGRAARNAEGRVILYADEKTPAIEELIEQTNARRKKQLAYNREHNIVPRTIIKAPGKSIVEIIGSKSRKGGRLRSSSGIADAVFSVEGELNLEKLGLSESEGRKLIDELTAEMLSAAEALEFERAADLRDQIKALKKEK